MKTVLDLCNWTVRESGADSPAVKATVPGCVHHDLQEAGLIPDPYLGENELQVQWVGERDWIYETTIVVDQAMLQQDRLLLVCEGLDTLARISINGRTLAETDNMFRQYSFEVKDFIHCGANTIAIHFSSARAYTREKEALRHLDTPKCCPHEDYGRPYIRKEQCNFGWDWGPVLVTCGIWRAIRLESYAIARIDSWQIQQKHEPDAVTLLVAIEAESWKTGPLSASVQVILDGHAVTESRALLVAGKGELTLPIPNPQLWWPAGRGRQPLYSVEIALSDEQGNVLDHASRRIGLRTLELIREKDAWGESFTFSCNGQSFFSKGANWIPTDQIKTRITDERLRDLLQSAVDGNMNMIRVWGGGYYEYDSFYDLCDELGLCIWQDFMFACSSYPTDDPHFMDNVAQEAVDQIKRLRHHACLALWCGNNELEMWIARKNQNHNWPLMPWPEYEKLFDRLLPDLVQKHDPATAYWPCSPHSPLGNRDNHDNQECGDVHSWAVWHGRQPFEWYRTIFPRFCSEFGFQSFPEPRTVASYAQSKDEANITSAVMEHHQRSQIGNVAIMQYMAMWFPMPADSESLLWLSQIQQGLAIKYAVEHWRQNMERCRGALYWQLNDCWPVASWASIDYYHRWKALQYMSKRFFAPLMISGVEDPQKQEVRVYYSSDLAVSCPCTCRWRITSTDGQLLDSGSDELVAKPDRAEAVTSINCQKAIATHGMRRLLIWLELWQAEQLISHNLVTFVKPKHMQLQEVKYEVTSTKQEANRFTLQVKVDKPALWVWFGLDAMDARWSDNFACLCPGRNYHFDVRTQQDLTLESFESRLRVKSIRDCY
ncbi:MAG: glycoside hydrolase family 2 protein [Verrucomicrobiota bacterium]|nr:glycoside hydrolase family 2 protein [Verrucomicrobiota bacterium]